MRTRTFQGGVPTISIWCSDSTLPWLHAFWMDTSLWPSDLSLAERNVSGWGHLQQADSTMVDLMWEWLQHKTSNVLKTYPTNNPVIQKISHGNGLLTFCPGTFTHISRILYMQMNGRHPIKDDSCNKGFLQYSLPSVGRCKLNREATSWGANYNKSIYLYQLQMPTITTHCSNLSHCILLNEPAY